MLVSNMKSFASLEVLYIGEINGLVRCISRYNYIIDLCPPSMEELHFVSDCEEDYWDRAYDAENISALKIEPHPNNNVKTSDIGESCYSDEESVKYIMKKFRGLEHLNLDIWNLIDELLKEVMIDLLRYVSSISKFSTKGYLDRSGESKISELVTTFMQSFTSFPVENPTSINARLVLKQSEEDIDEMEKSGEIYFELKNHENSKNNGGKGWSNAQYNDNNTVAHLDVEFVRDANEIVPSGFVLDFMNEHGSILKQFYFSAYSPRSPNLMGCSAHNLYTIHELETIVLKNCNKLRNLELNWMDIQGKGNTQSPTINNSTVRLKLDHSWIDPEALSELISRLTALKELCITNCVFFPNTTTNDNELEHSGKIYMPDKSLDPLTLHWSGEYTGTWTYQYTKLHMKIFFTSWLSDSNQERKYQFGLS